MENTTKSFKTGDIVIGKRHQYKMTVESLTKKQPTVYTLTKIKTYIKL